MLVEEGEGGDGSSIFTDGGSGGLLEVRLGIDGPCNKTRALEGIWVGW